MHPLYAATKDMSNYAIGHVPHQKSNYTTGMLRFHVETARFVGMGIGI